MVNEIDNLSVAITANANGAVSAINRLASAVGGMHGVARNVADTLNAVTDGIKKYKKGTESTTESIKKSTGAITTFWAALKKGAGLLGTGAGKLAMLPKFFAKDFVNGVGKAAKSVEALGAQVKKMILRMAVRAAIKMFVEGIKEGMTNLYEWSKLVDKRFATTMDRLASSSLYLKNSLGAMAAPLIQAVAPAIEFIINKLVDMFNVANQIFARLTGQSTYTAAKKIATTWGEADKNTKKTGNNIKKINNEIKKTILGFDEINKLEKQSDPSSGSSGSGSSSGSGANYASMFETRTINGKIKNFADRLKSLVNAGDWKGLGTLIGNKINQLVDSIDFAKYGQKIGYGINAWFSTKYWTLNTMNFTKIGSSIAVFLNNLIGQIDFEILGRSLAQKVTIIGDTIIGFFHDFDFGQAGQSLNRFVVGIFNELSEWFVRTDWAQFGKDVVNGIVAFFEKLDIATLASTFAHFMGTALGAGAKLITGIGKAIWEKVIESFNNIKGFFSQQIEECGGNIFAGILRGIIVAGTNLGVWIVNNIFKPFINGIKEAFGIASPAKKMLSVGVDIVLGIFKGIKDALVGIGTWIKTNLFDPFMSALKQAGSWIIDLSARITTKASELWNGENGIKTKWTKLKNKVVTLDAKIATSAANLWGKVSDAWYRYVRGRSLSINCEVEFSYGELPSGMTWRGGGGSFAHGGYIYGNGRIGRFGAINAYARGTNNARGSLFLAGEAGPEVVGHIGGRTEVLNKSQLAATMFKAVRAAMSGIAIDMNFGSAGTYGSGGDDSYMLAEYVRTGIQDATARQIDLLREQNRLLQELIQKPFMAEITTNGIVQSLQRKNRRDGTTVVPVLG